MNHPKKNENQNVLNNLKYIIFLIKMRFMFYGSRLCSLLSVFIVRYVLDTISVPKSHCIKAIFFTQIYCLQIEST